MDRTVQEYAHDLSLVRLGADNEQNRRLNKATKEILSNQNHLAGARIRLKKDLEDLKKAHSAQQKPHLEQETELRKRKMKMQVELQNWINKYDEHMGRLQVRINVSIRTNFCANIKPFAEIMTKI